MKGIIIAGGLGTRMRPLTYSRPKHLLPVANRPFLEYQIELMKSHGIDEIVFATNYFADLIEAQFGDGSCYGLKMKYALEDRPLGTAGAVRNASKELPNETIIVFNGDILTDFNLGELIQFHNDRNAEATIALRPVNRPHAFGALSMDETGRVTNWHEPTEEEKKAVAAYKGEKSDEIDYINAGIYILAPELVASIPTDRPVSVERETYPSLIRSGAGIYGYAPTGFWLDIGHPSQYLAANMAVASKNVSTNVLWSSQPDGLSVGENSVIDESTVLGPNVTIGQGVQIKGSVLLDGCNVLDNCVLDGVICEEGVTIEADVSISGGVIAAGSIIKKGTRL
ncbi:MAG: NDP-sugar synthase [Chthonomonadales bacterium]